MLTFTIALAMWAFLRALDEDEPHPRAWAYVMAASMGVGLLLKSLIGVVFPVGAGLVYLALTQQLFSARTWKRLHPFTGALIALAIALPWHVLATLRNPPYFAFTLHSGPGEYHGFLWFYVINEQLLRFLNLRYPRDYSTVPRALFWGFHLLWLFPFSVYFPAVVKLSYRPIDRAGRTRLLALCWAGFILVFFTFSTTQEYYSMPCYPALALLLGSAMAMGGRWVEWGTRVARRTVRGLRSGLHWHTDRGPQYSGNRRHIPGGHPAGELQTLAGAHAGPYPGIVCLHAPAADAGGRSVHHRGSRNAHLAPAAGVSFCRRDDDPVLPGGAAGHGAVRSLSLDRTAGGCAAALSRRADDHLRALLSVFVGLLLYRSACTAMAGPADESDLWLVCPRRAGRLPG